jgi:hypothetical protein
MHGFVIHSNLLGVHVESLETFSSKVDILGIVPVSVPESSVRAALRKFEGAPYDIGAMLYLGLRYLIPALPKKNLWQTSGLFLCTELVTQLIGPDEDHLITPYQLYLRLTSQHKESSNE